MTAALKFSIVGDPDSAVKAMRTVRGEAEKSSKGISSSFKKLAGIGAGLIAAGGVKEFLSASMKEAEEAQKVSRQTAAVIASSGAAAHVSAAHVDELSNSISKYAGIDDEAIAAGENLLLTFGKVRNEAGKGNDVFDQATTIMTDMAVALGTDVPSQAKKLGKALNDPVKGMTALARVGVVFTDQQKAQITAMVKNNDTLGAQKLILAELDKKYGGSAAAQATATDKMKVALGNLEEQVGTALLPVVEGLANFLTDKVVPAFSAVVGWIQDNKTTVKVLAGVVGGLWAAYKGYKILTAVSAALSLSRKRYAQWVAQLSYGNRAQAGLSRFLQTGVGRLGAFGLAAGVAGFAVYKLGKKISDWTEGDRASKKIGEMSDNVAAFRDELVATNGVVDQSILTDLGSRLQESGLADRLGEAGIGLDQVTKAVTGTDAEMQDLLATWVKMGDPRADSLFALQDLHRAYQQGSGDARELATVTADTGKSMDNTSKSTKKLGEQAVSTSDAVNALSSAFDRLNGRTLDVLDAEIAWRDSLVNLRKELKGHNKELGLNTAQGRKHLGAIRDSIKAAQQDSEATFERTRSSEKARKAFEDDIGTLKEHLIQLGYDRGEVQKLIDKYAQVPPFKKTKFEVDTAQAERDVQDFITRTSQGKFIQIGVRVGAGPLRSAFAAGTSSAPAGWAWVGERGPELMHMRGGERVLSHPTSMRVSRGYATGTDAGPARLSGRMRLEVDSQGGLWAILDGIVEDKLSHRRSVIGMDY
jgi:hypothetical protein